MPQSWVGSRRHATRRSESRGTARSRPLRRVELRLIENKATTRSSSAVASSPLQWPCAVCCCIIPFWAEEHSQQSAFGVPIDIAARMREGYLDLRSEQTSPANEESTAGKSVARLTWQASNRSGVESGNDSRMVEIANRRAKCRDGAVRTVDI